MDLRSCFTLNNGVGIPALGFGVFQAEPGEETHDAVLHALETGYRHIDTARVYRNEHAVGEALRESGVPRGEVFVTTKLWNRDHGFEQALAACDASLNRLGLDFVDLYLVHWPVEELRGESWRALEQLYREGKCRAIGVSNYTVRHLEELLASCEVVPVVNQVEFSPFTFQSELLDFCREHGIQLEAYSPLTKGLKLDDLYLKKIAAGYDRTPAQLLLRWCLEHKVVTIPKSVTPARIEENARVFDFEIAAEDMHRLNSLDKNLRTSWDPTDAP